MENLVPPCILACPDLHISSTLDFASFPSVSPNNGFEMFYSLAESQRPRNVPMWWRRIGVLVVSRDAGTSVGHIAFVWLSYFDTNCNIDYRLLEQHTRINEGH